MLIDEKLFEIAEILQLFESEEDFVERVNEGLDLIQDEAKEGGEA